MFDKLFISGDLFYGLFRRIFNLLKHIYILDRAIYDAFQKLSEISSLKDEMRNRFWSQQTQVSKNT